ncbi:MAG: RAMP superfamily CRISPR-associated protein, partial [Cetobacterium sp.]
MAKGKIQNVDLKNCQIKIGKEIYKIDKNTARILSDDIFAKNSEVEYIILENKNISIKKLRGLEFIKEKSVAKNIPSHSGNLKSITNSVTNSLNKTNMIFSYPYNFVRVGEKVEREAIDKGELSGKIVCTLTNRSPLFFPEPKSSEVSNNHSKEMFYKRDEKYIIPASSLKGSFRSVLEAISNSCLLNIENERLEKRLGAGAFNDRVFGIIKRLPTEHEDGLIVEATVLKVKTEALPFEYKDKRGKGKENIYDLPLSNLIKNYEHINNSNDFGKITNGKKDIDGILWISSDIFSKKHEKILYPTQNGKSFKFTMDEYKDIEYLLKQRSERDLKKSGKEFYIEDVKSGDPIIFQVDKNGNAKNLAFSEIPRLRYKYSPYDLVPEELKACDT